MNTGSKHAYKCYFDASFTPTMSSCAFAVKRAGKILYSHACCEVLATSQIAEQTALNLLLQYIQENLEPGSTVRIYGDCQSAIDALNAKKKGGARDEMLETLYKLRGAGYTISLQYIPRRKNRTAHKLAKDKLPPQPPWPQGLQVKEWDFSRGKHMALDDIIIPAHMTESPRAERHAKRLEFYETHGRVYKPIHVNGDDVLVDGYISYLILKAYGEHMCQVIVEESSG